MPEPSPNPPPTDTVRVALSGYNGACEWANVFWLLVTRGGAPSRVDLVDVAQHMFDLWPSTLGDDIADSVHLTQLQAVWHTGVSTRLEATIEGDHSGADGNPTAPGQVCALINWSIEASYRGGHPRTYLPGIPQVGIVDDRYLAAAYRAGYTTKGTAWLNGVNILSHGAITSVTLGTVSFFRHNAALAPPVFHPYLVAGASRTLATQRRRVRPR